MNRWLVVSLLLVAGVAVALRAPRLEERPMHNDEAVNAIKFRQLWEHHGYQYDPNEHHGPALYYATLALEKLTSAPDFPELTASRLRIVTVLFGIGLIVLLPLMADGLGRKGAAWAALFTAVSPAMVFYSRYFIHEMLLVFFTFLAMAAGWRYGRSRKIGWALVAGAAAGLMAATKETFVLSLAAGILALLLTGLWNRWLDASRAPVRKPRVRLGHLAAGLGAWLAVAALLFSSFFSNAGGLLDSLRTYGPWLARAGGNSPHNHPWFFYFERLLYFHQGKGPIWSEGLILALGLVGAGAGFVRKGLGAANGSLVRFLALYTFILAAAYSSIAYKTPWCLLGFWHGMILLAGVGAAALVGKARPPIARPAMAILLLAGAGQLANQAWQASQAYSSDIRNPYVYAPTAPDLLTLVEAVESVAEVSPEGRHTLIKVMAPQDDYWPLPWYLRQFDRVGWWPNLPADPYAPIMIVASDLRPEFDATRTHLMCYSALRPQVFFELYVESGLWREYVARRQSEAKERPGAE
jgi:uncharacterized protein (TIGR03663 family)